MIIIQKQGYLCQPDWHYRGQTQEPDLGLVAGFLQLGLAWIHSANHGSYPFIWFLHNQNNCIISNCSYHFKVIKLNVAVLPESMLGPFWECHSPFVQCSHQWGHTGHVSPSPAPPRRQIPSEVLVAQLQQHLLPMLCHWCSLSAYCWPQQSRCCFSVDCLQSVPPSSHSPSELLSDDTELWLSQDWLEM